MAIQDQVGPLRRVYVRAPEDEALLAWRAYGWHDEPDPVATAAEHLAFRGALEDAGAEVVTGSAAAGADPDAIYVYDPVLMTDRGTILLRPGKPGRRGEPAVARADLEAAGVRVLAALDEPALAEGGDLLWLDGRTLLAGVGFRTNEAGVAALRGLLAGDGVEVLSFDLPHLAGPGACTHLLSFLSPLDADLVVAFLPQLPVRLVQLLRDRGVGIVEVPEEELETMGPNVLALAPRVALALEGNPVTRARMEAAGVDVRTYAGRWISRAGDGGPTCLTRPLERG
jgi:N-dimethylarginine dimethylaminohydrolase